MDRWIPNNKVLFNTMLDGTNIIDITLSVSDITRDNGKWNAEFLSHYLPTTIVNIINAIPPPLEDDGFDSIGWNGTNDYEFSTKSAYINLCGDRPGVEGDWSGLWKWKGPHRIQTFMWLAAHGRLLTNARRHRWSSSISAQCPLCNQNDETLMHVLRDCMYATRVWLKIIPSPRVLQFFDTVDRDWVFDNISSTWLLTDGAPWHSVYMVTCWFLWNWRNKSIFETNFERPHNEVAVILKYVTDITNSKIVQHQRQHIDTVMVRWKPPDIGWIKLNCDGACKLDLHKAGCGGLLRDSFGRWVRGFAYHIGDCTALQAEMWGMWLGMQLAKRMGFTNLIIESDSKVLVDLITSVSANSGESYKLIRRMQRLLSSDWHIRVIHVWREGNRCADWLANYGLQLDSNDMVELEHPPSALQQILFDDQSGASMPRNIRVVD